MLELSVFIDESGSDDLLCPHYLVTLVTHDQSVPIDSSVTRYERALADSRLPNVPFHAVELLNGHGGYSGLDAETRSRLLTAFRVLVRHLPIRYKTFAFKTAEYEGAGQVSNMLRRQLVDFIFDNLGYFQGFDSVKIYYDGGQGSVSTALHKALDYALCRSSLVYKPASARAYRLSQVADYLCMVELAELRYQEHAITPTYEKFLGGHQRFKKGILKEARQMRFA